MLKKLTCVCVLVLALGLAASRAVAGVAYSDPPGGWRYVYPGVGDANPDAAALDGNWDHNNGSDAWDGSLIGAGQAGGIIALSEGGVSFLRIQDALTSGSGTDSRKIYFGHSLTAIPNPMPQATADQILSVEGVTLSFRARLATTPPLDGTVPAGGDGYVIHDGGKGPFGIHQEAGGDQIISFGLVLAGDTSGEPKIAGRTGLCMNNLNGTAPSGTVDIQGNEAGTLNMLDIADLTTWHEFWITIRPDTSGEGTHKVQVWMDGSMVPSEFNVTAGTGGDYGFSYVGMGAGATPQAGATDVDFFAYKEGVHLPPGAQTKAYDPIPEDGLRTRPSGPQGDGFWMLMTFTTGDWATLHTAYFSKDFDDVNDRNAAVRLGSPPYPDEPGFETAYYVGLDDPAVPEFARTPLDRGITYYWVVDESNGTSTYPGDVWSFTIASDTAWSPTPPDGAQNIKPASVALAWLMGDVDTANNNISYDVYWGTDEAAVAADTIPDAHVTSATHTIGSLLNDTDYYWKVNTVLMPKNPPFIPTIIPGDVWQFKTRIFTPFTDDDTLVGWWTFEPDTGNIVFDQSGYNNDGTIVGGTRGPGYIEDAIVLDGVNDYVNCGNSSVLDFGTGNWTVCAWVQVPEGQADTDTVFANGGDEGGGIRYALAIGEATNDGCVTLTTDDDTTKLQAVGDTPFNDGEWHHVVGQRLDSTLLVFVDAAEDASNPGVPVGYNLSGTSQHNACIGAITDHRDASGATLEKYFEGSIDDVRVYNRALSSREIKVLGGRLNATDPDPANGATGVSRTPTLSWSPGVFVASVNGNIVYYSEDAGAVTNRTAPSATVTYPPTYPVPGTLDLGTTFYWAVDTVNGVDVWPGELWRFTTIDWLPVDDMESYVPWTQSGNHIFEKWRDAFGDCTPGNGNNTGSTLTENADPVNGGIQSMKYDYDNDGTIYSPCAMSQEGGHLLYSKIEAQIAGLPSGIGTNWTIQGVKALSLRFYGGALNGVEPMWVQLKDATKGYGNKVTYGDYQDEDRNAVTEESWDGHEWFIDMADFGVDLNNLVSISIGFGNDDGTGDHGSGTIYFDDFRLYTPRCFAARHSEEMAKIDFAPLGAPDCVVNYEELDVMAADWLLTDVRETGELLVRWQFNETAGTTAMDTSGKGHHGDVNDVNGVSWVNDAERGRCLDFAGGDNILDNDANTYLNGLHGLTISVWVKNRETIATDKGFIIFEDPAGNDDRDMRYDAAGGNGGGTSVIKCGVTTTSPVGQPIQQLESSSNVQTTAWQHLALTWSTGEQLKLYINGVLDTPTDNRPGTVGVTTGATKLIVGRGGKGNTVGGWNGLIDDVQIYNYALSAAEIATVKAGGAIAAKPVHYPVPSSAEIYEGEAEGSRAVNFKDYAELMDSWLLEIKYPQ